MNRFTLLSRRNALISLVPVNCALAFAWAEKPDSPTVSKRIAAIRSLALALDGDAADLLAFVHDQGDWLGHAAEDRRIAFDIDSADETAREAIEMIELASPRQEAVVHKIVPLLRDLVNNVRLSLEHIKIKPSEAHSSPCIEYVEAHRDLAKHLAFQIAGIIPPR